MKDGTSDRRGYTLTELLVAVALSTLIAAGAFSLFTALFSHWKGINCRVQADCDINMTMSQLVYGVAGAPGLRNVVSDSGTIVEGANGWTLSYSTPGNNNINEQRSLVWSRSDKSLTFNPGGIVVGKDITDATVVLDKGLLLITVRLERSEGRYNVCRELETEVLFRNL